MRKKMIAPIIIAILIMEYYICIAVGIVSVTSGFASALLVLAVICIGIVLFMVTRERINEIRSGEEDDLGKY